MNFDFSADTTAMREQARRFLSDRIAPGTVRRQAESGAPFDAALWSDMARMGWLGAAVPEAFGGAGLGYEALCMLAEEIGRTLAPVPFSSSIYLGAEALLLFGTPAQMRRWLPAIADGSVVATLALAEGAGEPAPANIAARVRRRRDIRAQAACVRRWRRRNRCGRGARRYRVDRALSCRARPRRGRARAAHAGTGRQCRGTGS
ncbi:MAG: acyl-CoA dehydrogenase family protein [Rhodospirillales bacterium]